MPGRIFLMVAMLGCPLIAGPAGEEAKVARVSVLASDKLLLNGRDSELPAIEAELKRLKVVKGEVWYYRENAQSEPSEKAMAVVRLVVDNRLPISMSTKPDFSDYVDAQGKSHPRKQ